MRKSSNLRQSLATGEFSGPSNENSPTTASMKTRRVSFANKKHIKEFCDSAEQGTLWVNTYEESDSSQLRNSHNSNMDEQTMVGEQGSEPLIQGNENSTQPNPNIRNSDFLFQESKNTSAPESPFDVGFELRVGSAARKNGEMGHLSVFGPWSFGETGSLLANSRNPTFFNDVSMNVTGDEMNETAPVPSILQSTLVDTNLLMGNRDNYISPQRIPVFHDRSMDLTEAVESVPRLEDQQNMLYDRENTDETMLFHDKQMDFTEVVQNVPRFDKQGNMIYEKEKTEKTTIFHDNQMDFTEVVPHVSSFPKHRNMIYEKEKTEKTTIFHDKEMDFTEVVHNVPISEKQINGSYDKENTDKTTLFHDKEMDFTEVVPHVPSIEKQRNIIYEKEKIEKTTIFHDKEMDFTEVVANVPSIEKQRNKIYEKENTEKTTIFHDKEMDFTEVVHNVPRFEKQRNMIYEKENTEKTTIFNDKSIDYTDVVQNVLSIEKHQNIAYENTSKKMPGKVEKIANCSNVHELQRFFEGMKENIPKIADSAEKSTHKTFNNHNNEKPTNVSVCHDDSMEMTKPQGNLLTERQNKDKNVSRSPAPQKTLLEYSETNSNPQLALPRSKENVAADSSREINSQRVNPPKAIEPSQKTTVFSDDSMELTLAAKFPQQVVSKNYENNGKYETHEFSGILDFEEKENEIRKDLKEISRTRPNFSQIRNAYLDKKNWPVDKENCSPNSTINRAQDNKIQNPLIENISARKCRGAGDYKKKYILLNELQASLVSNDLTDVSGIIPFAPEEMREFWYKDCSKNNENNNETKMRNEEMSFTSPIFTSFHKSHSNVENTNREGIKEKKIPKLQDFVSNHERSPSKRNLRKNYLSHDISQLSTEQSSFGIEKLLINDSKINPESSIDSNPFKPRLQLKNAGSAEQIIEKPQKKTVEDSDFVATERNENNSSKFNELNERDITNDSNARDISSATPFCLENEKINCDEKILIENLHSSTETSLISTEKTRMELDNSLIPAAKLSDEFPSIIEHSDEDIELPSRDENVSNVSISKDNVDDDNQNDGNSMIRIINNNRSQGQLIVQDIDGSYLMLENSIPNESLPNGSSNQHLNQSETMNEEDQEKSNETSESIEPDSFSILKEKIENLSKRSETIWSIKHMDEKVIAFNFLSKSIVLVVRLEAMSDPGVTRTIKRIDLLSQLVEGKADPGLQLTHSLVMKKLDAEFLSESFKSHEEIPQLLEHVSREVKVGMDFLFILENLRNHNVMEFDGNRVTFLARTRCIRAGIIANVTIDMKPFEEINSKDVTVTCLVGSAKIKPSAIQQLVTNVKRDHRFLQLYMTDVKNYLELSAEMGARSRNV